MKGSQTHTVVFSSTLDVFCLLCIKLGNIFFPIPPECVLDVAVHVKEHAAVLAPSQPKFSHK